LSFLRTQVINWLLSSIDSIQLESLREFESSDKEPEKPVRYYILNLLKNEKIEKQGAKGKRLKAGWDNQYLLKVLKIKA